MKIEFTTKNQDGTDVELAVVLPSPQHRREAQVHYSKSFSANLRNGVILREKLNDYIKEQGLWDDNKQKQADSLAKDIRNLEQLLAKGGIKKSEAFRKAKELKKLRNKMVELTAEIRLLDNNTAQGQADNARFDYYVSVCTVYKDSGEPYFKGLEDYYDQAATLAANDAANKLAELLYGLDSNYEANLPENRFLRRFGYVDDKLRLINSKGQLIDETGRLINETGHYIDEKGNLINFDGVPVNEEGEPIIEALPFLDDDGKPIAVEE
jgi:hypothetical protein